MEEKTYLAIVDSDFTLSDEVTAYFAENQVRILKYHSSLGILQLQSKRPLDSENLQYVNYIERDKIFSLQNEEE